MKWDKDHEAKLFILIFSFIIAIIMYLIMRWIFGNETLASLYSSVFYFFLLLGMENNYHREKDKEELKKYVDSKIEESYTELSFKIGDTREEHERKMHHERRNQKVKPEDDPGFPDCPEGIR